MITLNDITKFKTDFKGNLQSIDALISEKNEAIRALAIERNELEAKKAELVEGMKGISYIEKVNKK